MHIPKRKYLLLALGLVVAMIITFATVQRAYVAPPSFDGEASSYRYTVQGQRNGGLYVNVGINFDDANSLSRYLEVNRQRGRELASRAQGPLPIQITFARPLPLDEVRDLVRENGIQVDSFAIVGRSSTNGKKGVRIEFSSVEKEMPSAVNVDPTGQGEQLVFTGVMVIQGKVVNPQSLTRLLADGRIYLLDTSETEVRDLLAKRHANITVGKEITVNVPSPFWRLTW